MPSESDSTQTDRLLQSLSQGDPSALARLLTDHREYLKRLVELRMDRELQGRFDASDVVQETDIQVSRHIDEFLRTRPMSFRLWLRRCALDQLIELRRRHLGTQKRSVWREVRLSDVSSLALSRNLFDSSPSNTVRRKEQAQQVRQAIMSLSEMDREVLLLRHVEELTTGEIAELLEINPATARQRLGRAFRRLCQKLANEGLTSDHED